MCTHICTFSTPIVNQAVTRPRNPEISIERLVKGVIVPSLKGSFVRVKIDNVHALPGQLEPKGLYSQESLITIDDDGCMLVSMVNVHGT